MPVPFPVYRPRNPKQTPYYRCVEDHLETLEQVYEDRFERTYGFFRPHVKQVMERYLDCGNLLNGFARIKLELSRCIWETLKIYYQSCLPGKNSVPGAVIALQTFGDFLGFNPHGHVLLPMGASPRRAYLWSPRRLSLNIWKKSSDPKFLPYFSLKAKSLPILLSS